MVDYKQRSEKLLSMVKSEAVLIQTQPNIQYYSGFTGDSGGLLITENKLLLFTDFRYVEQAQSQAPLFETIEFSRGQYHALLQQAMQEQQLLMVGFEDATLLYHDVKTLFSYDMITWVPVSNDIEQLRIIKDEYELEQMRAAAKITDQAFLHILKQIKEGVTEIDLALELEFFMRKNGASDVSFAPIVASGSQGALPHAIPSMRKIQNGDLITMDFGCIVNGYCSDMTRTVALGTLASDLKNVYNICLEAQLNAYQAARVGMMGCDLDAVARDHIAAAGFGECFGHGLGHGIGLNIHEAPTISPAGKQTLQAGMVFSIEPGIYRIGCFGVRIEDFGVLTSKGFESFVHSEKELICL